MSNVEMIHNEECNTWNVFVDNEWYYEGNYEQCCDVADSFRFDDRDEYYGDDGDEGWIPEEEEYYTPSATHGDYSPSCPWKAPGMSISDFI